MKLLQWDPGRQRSGYSKLLLAQSTRFKFDCYIIRMPQGCVVPSHFDSAPEGFEHHRLNITLWKPKWGGETFIAKRGYNQPQIQMKKRAYRFRPDVQSHSVTACMKGSLVLFSVGWLKRK